MLKGAEVKLILKGALLSPANYAWAYFVFIFALLCRAVARLVQAQERRGQANLRILVVTEGILVRMLRDDPFLFAMSSTEAELRA